MATGSSYFPFFSVLEEALTIVGEFKEYTLKGETGKLVHRGFCINCGTTLFGRPEAVDGLRTISASTLDSPREFKPQMNTWITQVQPWVLIDHKLENFDKNPF